MLLEISQRRFVATCGFAATDAMNESDANWIALGLDHNF